MHSFVNFIAKDSLCLMFVVSCASRVCVSLLGFWLWEGKGCISLDSLSYLPNVFFAEKVIPGIPAHRECQSG